MAGRIDYDFAKLKVKPSLVVTTALRAKMLDGVVRAFVAAHPGCVVLDLGCGLDPRMARCDPPPGVDWYDIDFPEVVRLRRDYGRCFASSAPAPSSVMLVSWSRSMRMTVAGEGCRLLLALWVMTRREAISRRLRSWSRRCRAMDSMASSVTVAPPMAVPFLRADSWPSRVRSRMYSRSIPDRAASTVNTTPDRRTSGSRRTTSPAYRELFCEQ
ncbi:class I SAM-dependent methyltransferase [Nonomuraea sp. NPDC048892]|uniref:class I SAM-dependent methyltransferase n=1 Tax=Nonomuraea sp. NPDC048892 TaxID=3154624 RepID=UPI003404F3CA